MAMPNNFVLMRHGESEANVMQRLDKHGLHESVNPEVYQRPDWQQRLSLDGINHARTAGRWVEQEFGGVKNFDLQLVSPFYRTRETALYVADPDLDITDEAAVEAANSGWVADDRLVERHWGMYGTLTLEQQKEMFPQTFDLKRRDPWYTALDGGESQASGVRLRARDLHATLHREAAGKDVIAVTHGEYMWTARQVLERMLPEEWMALDDDASHRIRNCAVLHYTRVNPEDESEVDDHARWMRFIYTDNPEESPNGGNWQELPGKRLLTASDILGQLALAPPLLREAEARSR